MYGIDTGAIAQFPWIYWYVVMSVTERAYERTGCGTMKDTLAKK